MLNMINFSKSCNKLITIYKLSTLSTCNYTKSINFAPSQRVFPKLPSNVLFTDKQRHYCTSETSETQIDVFSLSDEQMNEITQGNEEQTHKLKVLLLEAEVMRQEGKAVPSQTYMKLDYWKELLARETRTGRRKYLEFLFKLEKKKENQIAKKKQKQLELQDRPPVVVDGAFRYDLGHNNMFLRFYDSTMNNMYNSKLISAMQFSQQIVIDCGYHEHMTKRENINCAKQLMLAFADNRAHHDPFDVHYCNLRKNAELEDYMHRFIPTMYDPEFPLNAHESSYLDLFPRERIVYLTPHCREELNDYDHDAVYVIGAIVDKINNEPVSLAKAKREGLKMAKLPLDKYLMWGAGGGKSLTINQVLSIMLDMRMKGDWEYALRHVPKRKILQYDEAENAPRREQRHGNKWQRARSGDFTESPPEESMANRYQRKSSSGWRPKAASGATQQNNNERLVHLKNILKD